MRMSRKWLWFIVPMLVMSMILSPTASVVWANGDLVNKEQTSSITLTVKGDSVHGTILPGTSVPIQSSDTAFTVLLKTLGNKVEYMGSGSSVYVQAIDGLAEFDRGPLSGWMFRVNGEFPPVSAGAYQVKSGDQVDWLYTCDGGKDLGSPMFSSIEFNSPSKVVKNNLRGSKPKEEALSTLTKNEDTKSSEIVESVIEIKAKGMTITQVETSSLSWKASLEKTKQHILKKDSLTDWEVVGLVGSGASAPSSYLQSRSDEIQITKGNYRKVTDLERMVLGIVAAGENPLDLAGYNLIEKIYDHEKMTMMGNNGVIFALIALDSKAFQVPPEAKWTREKLIDYLLQQQNEDGGWALAVGKSDVDITAMAITALAPYRHQPKVEESGQKALRWLSQVQNKNGGFEAWGVEASESASQVLIALSSWKVDPHSALFTKNGHDVLGNLLSYQQEDGGFAHTKQYPTSNGMATEQALQALVAYQYYLEDRGLLYQFPKQEEPKPDPKPEPKPQPQPKPKPKPQQKPQTPKSKVDVVVVKVPHPVHSAPRISPQANILNPTGQSNSSRIVETTSELIDTPQEVNVNGPKGNLRIRTKIAPKTTYKVASIKPTWWTQPSVWLIGIGSLLIVVAVLFYLIPKWRRKG